MPERAAGQARCDLCLARTLAPLCWARRSVERKTYETDRDTCRRCFGVHVGGLRSSAATARPLSAQDAGVSSDGGAQSGEGAEGGVSSAEEAKPTASELRAKLDITEDYRPDFNHGEKGASYQKYIVLHDTEVDSSAASIVNSWESSGNKVASQFIVNKDGSIVQCVPMDAIAHHAGYGDAGHNSEYGVPEDGRDDKKGTTKAPSKSITDYGMNSYSIGIEIVHVGGQGAYPEAQLEAIDGLIVYIDAYYGSESTIIDHKMWRSGNSDTSAEFATYLANYRDHRTHN